MKISRDFLYHIRLPLLALLALCLNLASCSGDGSSDANGNRRGGGQPPRPVAAAPVIRGNYPVTFSGLGTVTAANTVTVTSRVDGQIMKLHFREGQVVNQGDLLAEVDPRPYQAQLEQAEGKLAQNRASLQNARRLLARYRVLLPQDSASPQQVDEQEAQVRLYEGAVRQSQGEVDAARLQLEYCRITAPLSGRLGLRRVDEGNMIRSSDTEGLVVITQVRPIHVLFTVTESQLPDVLEARRGGSAIAVEAWDRSFTRKLADGVLESVDNQIDTATGTVRLKAVFDNVEERLFPNQFVNARIRVDTLANALLVPSVAVQRGQKGFHVYVVGEGDLVSVRDVELGPADNDRTVVLSGVAEGERVVTDGVDRLREGVKVQVTAQRAS